MTILLIVIGIILTAAYFAYREYRVMKRISDEYNEIDKRLKSVSE